LVPLHDYEEHMTSGAVQQLGALSELFGEALRGCRPESVAILGVAGGNGLERIDPVVTRRVCGIDINPEYLRAVRERHAAVPGLELHCADLAGQGIELAPVQLVHAALIFEHAGVACCLDNAVNLVAPGGVLSVVLQLPSASEAAVGDAARPSIQALRQSFRSIDPASLSREIEGRGFRLVRQLRRPLASGKAFWMGLFERARDAGR
jgi:SAM-dependent methyltransferase